MQFHPLPLAGCTPDEKLRRLRMNGIGNLFYFTKFILGRRRLTENLHLPICQSLEREFIKDVYEIPRDHFKSTICSEALPVWWALPITAKDEDEFLKLGYPDEYVKWLHRIHRPLHRCLLVSENITNAAKLGRRIRTHFESNALYRACYPETLPTSSDKWTDFSLFVNRRPFGDTGHGEGTFDFMGVGGALQSRHYDSLIEDDLVGRKAIESPSIMESTIEYHKLLVGAFDSQDATQENTEIVIGNRWGFHDLNSYLREHEDHFIFNSHSALGGCCPAHPANVPIFPEEFTFEKLMSFKKRLGPYLFSCQFLNNPIPPEDADFRPEWLRYFAFVRGTDGRLYIRHTAVKDGLVIKDVALGHLNIAMAVDPNHSGNSGLGRCRHAIVVVGRFEDRFYLLETWAEAASYSTFVDKIYELGRKWHLRKFGLETIGAQQYLKFYLEEKNKAENIKLGVIDLKGEVEAPDGSITRKKEFRIRTSLSPLFEDGQFFVQQKQQDFIQEYSSFPKGKFVDQLDALAYIPQMLRNSVSHANNLLLLQRNQERARRVNTPYSVGIPKPEVLVVH